MAAADLDPGQLRVAVQDVWNGQYSVDHLNQILVRSQDLLLDPLKQTGPDAASRQQIQSMRVKLPGEVQEITLQSDVVAWIVDFSDALELNELEVLKLLLQAFRMNADDRRRCDTERETAVSLYFSQRQDVLIALLDIVQMFEGDHDFSPELVRITQSFLDRLKEQGLVPNIISRLRALSKLKLSLYSPHIDNEIRLISLVLFYIEVNTGIDSKAQARVESPNAIALSALTEEMSVAIPSVRLHQDHHQQVLSHCHSITTSIYVMFTTLIHAMMDSGVATLPAWTSAAPQSPLANSHKALSSVLQDDRQSQHSDSDEFQRLIFNGFAGFGAFIQQLPSLNEVARVDICSVLAKFFIRFLRRHLAAIRAWKDPKSTLGLLGSLVADICRTSPSQVACFWQCPNLPTLLHSLDQETLPDSAAFSSYVDLILALSADDHCVRAVQFISSAKQTSWHRIFDLFHRAVAPALKHEQPLQLLPIDVRILCDLARLVQVMARCGPTVNSISFQQFQVLDTLFQMLACTFPVRLKAELFTAVTCWVQGRPSEASQIWDRLESMQVLPTLPESSSLQSRGLVHDLEEIEARDGTFPLTKAFMLLLQALLQATPNVVLEKIGAPLRSPGIGPYIRHIRLNVLSKLNGRTFNDIAEKWSLATPTLKLLCFLVASEENADVLESFMRSGSAESRAVLDLILSDPDMPTLESALHLIRLVLLQESNVANRMTRASQDCVPLSVVILRQPQTVAVLCQLIGSAVSLAVQTHAVSIVKCLAQHDSTLIARLLQSQHLVDVVRRQWASQILYASSDHEHQCQVISCIIDVLMELSSWPSFAHLLLGFDTTSTAADTKLIHASGGCLSAVIELIEKPGFLQSVPNIAASGLNLICMLLEDATTCDRVFQYINLHRDNFFVDCLQNLPILSQDAPSSPQSTHYLLQAARLLKSIALDLHLRRADRALDECSAIALLGLSNVESEPKLMISLLESVRPQVAVDLPEFGGLDRQSCVSLGKEVLMSCIDSEPNAFTRTQHQGVEFLWRIPKLRSAAARAGLNVTAVEKAAIAFNDNVRLLSCTRLIAQTWTQLLSVWLLERDLYELDPTLLLDLLIAVLGKISDPAWSPCSLYFANAALLLIVHIRALSPSAIVNVDHRIVQGVLSGIMNNQNHQTRAHLCAVFYAYMDFMSSLEAERGCGGRGREWALVQALSDLHLSPGSLIQRICDHAISGSASIRALSITFLCAYPLENLVALLEVSSQVVRFVQAINSSSDLRSAICPDPSNYHLILSFESHLLLLLHISQSVSGAKSLVAADLISRLSDCEFFALRPSDSGQAQYAAGHPTAMQKYLQLVIPFLRLIVSLLSALPHRHDVHGKVVDVILVRYLKPFTAIILSPKSSTEEIEAYHAATGILLSLAVSPASSRPEVVSTVLLLLQQLPLQALAFRNSITRIVASESVDDEGPVSLAKEITRDMVALCSYLTQRRLLIFEPNIDPRLEKQDNGITSSSTDTYLPLGLVVYHLIPGALSLLASARSQRSHFDQALTELQYHEPDSEESLGVSRKKLMSALKSSQADECLSIIVIQHSLQIVFLSLQIFGSTTVESKQIQKHVDRLRDIIEQVALSIDTVDDLIEKQLQKIRQELDLSYGLITAPLMIAPAKAPGLEMY